MGGSTGHLNPDTLTRFPYPPTSTKPPTWVHRTVTPVAQCEEASRKASPDFCAWLFGSRGQMQVEIDSIG